ncbi:MAG: AAC(3) family N-acetyltransferase [Rubrivivax sp.]|nr:AAC(3) family N-acetyltransferase [Rubrivivax sp.]MDP3612620.1 AAC(3) family N-acetyltransferase [Rubrivivax sp.]
MSPLEFASGLALRHLNGAQVDALRDQYFKLRGRLAPVMKLVYGSFNTDELRSHLQQRVGDDFQILMVHSSVNHMKPMFTGTPLDMVRMLVDWCGPQRTLVMPAFYFGAPGFKGAADTFQHNPRFDLRRTPSQMGLATELFRRMPGVVISRHPVYRMAALGPLAQALTAGHEHASTPAGLGTPFEFMARHNARIVGIGKPMQVMTQAHHIEGAMGDTFPVPSTLQEPLPMTLVDRDQEIPFLLPRRSYQGRFNMWRLRQIMDRQTLQEWNFHHVPMFAARAGEVTQRLMDAARQGVTLYEPL